MSQPEYLVWPYIHFFSLREGRDQPLQREDRGSNLRKTYSAVFPLLFLGRKDGWGTGGDAPALKSFSARHLFCLSAVASAPPPGSRERPPPICRLGRQRGESRTRNSLLFLFSLAPFAAPSSPNAPPYTSPPPRTRHSRRTDSCRWGKGGV